MLPQRVRHQHLRHGYILTTNTFYPTITNPFYDLCPFEVLKQRLKAFADDPDHVQIEKEHLVVQIHNDLVEVELSHRYGNVYVTEAGRISTAEEWVLQRVAKLTSLADRILDYIPKEPHFVTPRGTLVDRIEARPDGQAVSIANVVTCAEQILNQQIPALCSIVYLTSDAGEGKTTIINEIARQQASRYKQGQAAWLLVPISLGGRTLLRFDDVIIASLVNRLRFPFLYFDAFVQLVRMGAIIPALDGFEEMFVETGPNQEAVSALGNLIRQIGGEGQVLIAARKAYFEHQRLEAQGRLLDTLPDVDVTFARIGIDRWGSEQFVEYCDKRGIVSGRQILDEVASKLNDRHHPLVTRAVLVRRLLDLAVNVQDRNLFLDKLRPEAEDFFFSFVDAIVEREAREKWIDKSGDPPGQLLTAEEHHELLARVAEEMWLNKTGALSSEYYDLVAQLFCEARRKSHPVSRQVIDRLKQHSLIVQAPAGKAMFSFDHEEFRDFFLGESIGRTVMAKSEVDLRACLRINSLPSRSMEIAAQYVRRKSQDVTSAVDLLVAVGQSEGPASFTRENCGGLTLRVVDGTPHQPLTLAGLCFDEGALQGRSIRDVAFSKCYFRATSLEKAHLVACRFSDCEFESLEISGEPDLTGLEFSGNWRCHSLRAGESDNWVYGPAEIRAILQKLGSKISNEDQAALPFAHPMVEEDEQVALIRRLLRIYMRATAVNDDTLRLRLGERSTTFFDDLLPILQEAGIIRQTDYRGRGSQSRYRLGGHISEIEDALNRAQGSFNRFISLWRKKEGKRPTAHP